MPITYDGVTFTGLTTDTSALFLEQWRSSIIGGTLSNYNKTATQSAASSEMKVVSFAPVPNVGKWYLEVTMSDTGNFFMAVGLSATENTANVVAARSNGATTYVRSGVTSASQESWSGGVIQLAIDLANNRMWVGRNGTWFSGGDPATGANPYYSTIPADTYYIWAQADNDNNGVGSAVIKSDRLNFTYSPPAGFLPLSVTTQCDSAYSSVSLLLPMNGVNASTVFTDFSPTPKTVTANGDTQISTAQSKWNGSSGYFDGNSDFLSTPDNAAFDFGSGDFCVEGWIYPTSFTGVGHIVGQWDGPGDQTWHIHVFTDGIFSMEYSTSGNYQPANFLFSSAGVLVANTWAHVAAARSGNTLRLFVNGVVVGSKDVTGITIYSASTASIKVGGNTNSQWYAGYMNDVRITKGVARYTGTFTPPTQPLPIVSC